MNYKEFSIKIYNLKKEGKFNEILTFLKANNFDIKEDKFVISNILMALRKTDNSKLVDTFIQEYNIDISIDEMVTNSYGWCIYDNLKNKFYPEYQIISKLQFSKFLNSNSKFSQMLLENIFKIGLKIIKDNRVLIDFLNLFNVDNLSNQEIVWQNRKLPSLQEKFYSSKSKVLFELQKYNECIEISQQALNKITKFHNNNDVWFARRIALSYKATGQIDEAIKLLKSLYQKKSEWFILKEIAELYLNIDKNTAFEYAIKAINQKAPLDYKVGLITLIGKLCNDENLAKQHFAIVKEIYQKNNWKIKDKVIENFNENVKVEIKTLQNYWKSFLPKGVVVKILNNNEKGKNGFIKFENKDYYFVISKKTPFINKIDQGKKVFIEIVGDRVKILGIA